MLFAGLQRQRVAVLAVEVGRAADDTTRHLPDELLLAGHETEVRPAG